MNNPGHYIQALGGYALDLYRLARANAINPHSLSKFFALRAMQRRTRARVLVEAGTFLGVTAGRCASHFDDVYTIELDDSLASTAAEWLKKYPNVHAIHGDAEIEVLRLISLPAIDRVIIFLDGHYSGGNTGSTDHPEPAMAILEGLARHTDKLDGIVVDDFREFGTQDGWPTKWQLVRLAEEAFTPHGFRLSVHFDQLFLERVAT